MKRLRIFLVVLLCVVVALSGDVLAGNKSKKGTAGALELLLPVGARGTALGGSYLAGISGVEAIHWNPAGLAATTTGSVEALFSHMNYIADIGVDYGAVGVRFPGFGTLAFSLKAIDFGDIPVTTEALPEGTGEEFSPSFVNFGVTYARRLTDRINVGATARFISESILRTSAQGFSFDAGVQYAFGGDAWTKGLRLAVALKNLGPTMQFDGKDLERILVPPESHPNAPPRPLKFTAQAFELPSTLELGLAYDATMAANNRLTLMGMFQNTNFGVDEYKLGAEYSYRDQIYLRGGYTLAPDEDKEFDAAGSESDQSKYIFGFTVGAGVSYNLGQVGVGIDYAYRDTDIFVGTNTFALRLSF